LLARRRNLKQSRQKRVSLWLITKSPRLIGEKKGKRKMKKSIFLTVLLAAFFVSAATAGPGDTLWTRLYGGTGSEQGYSVQQTQDGGYIITGYAMINWNYDVYLVKTDAQGDTTWTRTFGGTSVEQGEDVQQTSDGGYIIAGYTSSYGAGSMDFYLVKTDASGNQEWSQTYGGSALDWAFSVQQTQDGGFIVTGSTQSYGAGSHDIWLIKTDASGNQEWNRTFGGSEYDHGNSVLQTSDGGYIIAGVTLSYGAGSYDFWLIKTDASGTEEWNYTFGGTEDDQGNSVQQTVDGGYIIAGHTNSYGAGDYDVYLVKTDGSGIEEWSQTYGGSYMDIGESVWQTSDGGYILTGETKSYGAGSYDVYLVKTDASGTEEWSRAYGGWDDDKGYCIQQATDGGYITAGSTRSFGAGSADVWVLKIESEAPLPDVSIEIVPDDPPVTVPQGGSFGFTGTLTNNTEESQVVDAWTMAIGPQKDIYGPFKEFSDVELQPHQTRRAHFYQHVPNGAPLGFYNYIAYCGDYPSTVIDSSFFELEVIAGPSTGAGEAGWVLTGSFLEGDFADLPSEFALLSNYPNPFNASTVISYELPVSRDVKLEVYNLFGQKVATLVDGQQEAGYRSVTWDATEISSGVYFYKLTAGDYTETKRMMLIK